MAQSIVDYFKFVGSASIHRYATDNLLNVPVEQIGELLLSETPGPTLLFRSQHYDPTSIAVIDVLRDLHPWLFSEKARRYEANLLDILFVPIDHHELMSVVNDNSPKTRNTDELCLLSYNVYAAAKYWHQLIIDRRMASLIVVMTRTLAPSLTDESVGTILRSS